MTGKQYEYKVHGLGRVYDPEMDAWREPMTAEELRVQDRYREELSRSLLAEVPYDGQEDQRGENERVLGSFGR